MEEKKGYNSGINQLEGKEFIDEFLSSDNQEIVESRNVVLILMKSEEIQLIVEEIILGDLKLSQPDIIVEDRSTYWWIKAHDKLVIDLDIASSILGKDYNVYDFLVNVSSTMGRAYTEGNKFIITSELIGIETPLTDSE